MFLAWAVGGGHNASQTKCDPTLTAQTCDAARQVGTTVGVGLIIGLWVAVDIVLAVTYLLFRLTRKDKAS